MWELLSRGWYKLSFDGSARDNKVSAGFVARNNVGAPVGAGSFPMVVLSVPKITLVAYRRFLCGLQL